MTAQETNSSAMGFAPARISAMVNTDVLATHVADAAFLWRLRERCADAPHFDLAHLCRLDDRLHAHLLAIPLAGETGQGLAEQALGEGDPAALFVAAWLACARADAPGLSRLGALAGADAAHAAAMAAALTWQPVTQTEAVIRRLLAASAPGHRGIALRVLLERRLQPFGDLRPYLSDTAVPVRTTAATLAGVLKRSQDASALRALLADPHAGVQLAAARAVTLLGEADGTWALLRCAQSSPQAADTAAPLLVHCLAPAEVRAWIQSLARDASTLRSGIRAAGMFGDTVVADWLLSLMDDTRHARPAGEAFARMTGADLDPLTLRRDPPEDHDPDADPHSDEDAELGWPDARRIKLWWMAHRNSLPAGRRHLAGQPVSAGQAAWVLRHGRQRQRAQAATELALLNAKAMEFPVQAPGPWQRRRLGP